jgi:F-type H+-transporting ATPase subunit delta|tara:strand:- start:785 stop:1342 length:558 start_codon:yes stop_codon:yes gene_type:complete
LSSKSTFSNSTSKSYALALYELSKENSVTNKIEEEMKSLQNLIKVNPDFKEMISSPSVDKEDKKNVIFALADKNKFSSILKKFLGFITNKNRLFFLNKIIESFLIIISENKGELKVKLESSKELSPEDQKKIQSDLSNDFKSPLVIDYKHNPDLIAGLIIQVGSLMVDTSVKSKLKNLEKSMVEA